MRRSSLSTATIALAAAVGAALAAAPAASAGARDGRCEPGEFCYFHNSGQQGSLSDFTGSLADYGTRQPSCYEFRGPGAGKDECIKNDAAGAWNRTGGPVTVYFNSGFQGATQVVGAGARVDFRPGIKNQNASHRFGTTPTPTPPAGEPGGGTPEKLRPLTRGVYRAGGGRISAGFDGYGETSGKHEGIDMVLGRGRAVHALVSGEVTRVARGVPGSTQDGSGGQLSTIAVYHRASKRTVVFLHTNPKAGLKAGDRVTPTSRIGTEGYRGAPKTSAHTHVEVRRGRQTHAAVSVGDENLENDDPTAFWKARGYSIG